MSQIKVSCCVRRGTSAFSLLTAARHPLFDTGSRVRRRSAPGQREDRRLSA
jgi:hypothetical protein